MKAVSSILILVALVSVARPSLALGPVNYWSANYGGGSSDIGEAIAVDGDGNVYVTGRFQSLAYFGGGILSSAGSDDIFVAKYDATGAHVWSRSYGGSSSDQGKAIAVDYLGNVIVAGYFYNTVDFGGGPITSNGSNDIFLLKLDANGNHVWSHGFGGTGGDQAYDVTTDAGANVLVTGIFNNTVDFGGGNLISAGVGDAFVAKYTAAGAHTWSQRFGSTGNDLGYRIAVDALSRVIVTGQFRDTVDFGGGGITTNGGTDIFLAKYGITGAHMWSRGFGGTGSETVRGLDVTADGTIAIAGAFRDTADFGGTPLVSNGVTDVYVASYEEDGTHRWSRGFGGVDGEGGQGVGIDASKYVTMSASFTGSIDFGGGPIGEDSGTDIMVGRYTADGDHLWSGSFDASSHVFALGFALGTDSNTYITGYFSGGIDFGAGVLTSNANDVFMATFGPSIDPIITSITDIGNDQGNQVKIRFDRSGHDDAMSSTPVVGYDVYRRNDTPPPSQAPGIDGPQNATAGWTYLDTAPAHGESSYGIDVSTLADSTLANGQFWSAFFIRAATAAPATYWDSAPDSGYSLDNLAPGVPMGMALSGGVVSWTKPDDDDLDHFTVYGSNTNDFGAAVVVDYTTGESLDVSASPYSHYFVTATDAAGNEGEPARADAPTGVGEAPVRYVLSVTNYPNPFNPATTVKYTVPADGPVSIAIYDVRGIRVATLVDEPAHAAGAWDVEWNGLNDAGAHVPSGIYFARIVSDGVTRTRKMSLLK